MNIKKEMKIVIPTVIVVGLLLGVISTVALVKYVKYEFAPGKPAVQMQTAQYHTEPAHHPERTH